MGNNVGCSMICQTTPVMDTKIDEILITGYFVPCQICNSHFTNSPSKQHMDLNHYAAYTDQTDQTSEILCLLCGKISINLISHNTHINDKHPYAAKVEKLSKFDSIIMNDSVRDFKIIHQFQQNKSKKAAATKLQSETDFQIVKQVQTNTYQAIVKGITYDVVKYSKEYKRNGYSQEQMEAELIWFKIFKHRRVCKYYHFDMQPGQRNILCKGYIFFEQKR